MARVNYSIGRTREYGQLKKGQGEQNDRLDDVIAVSHHTNELLAQCFTDVVNEMRTTNDLLRQLISLAGKR